MECSKYKLIFITMIRDTIYNDLKEQGLILSSGAVLQLPPIRPPPATILRQVGGIFASQFSIGQGPFKVITLPVLNSAVLIARANTLICYKFQLDKQTAAPVFAPPKIENLSFVIKALHICDSRFLNDRGEVPFIVEADDRIVLFYVDLKEFKLIEKNTIAYPQIFSIRFLCEKEVLILTRQLQIHHYTIQSGKLKMKNKKISAAFPEIPKDQYIHHCRIVGNIDEEQDSTVALFYLIKKRKEKNFQVLKVKQFLRSFEGKIEAINEDYTVMMNLHSSVLPQIFQVWWFDGYYCIQTKHQILILKKKFKKYLFIDNIMEKIHDHSLRFNQGAIVSSYGKKAMELSVIQFGDPKCYSKILDTIEIDEQLLSGFRMLWPFKNEKETCLMFMFEKEKKLTCHNVIKMQPMKKMLDQVKKCQKSKISVIQQIAVNLGINKKDFYLTLWQSSNREIPDIYQFLLPCGDVSSIKKQIRLTMRRKKIAVKDFLKILQKITLIIRHELKTNLSQQMLKEYIKNDFLLRKIKLKDKDKRLDHRDLDKVYNSSIIDMLVQIIKNELYPQQKQVDPLHAMVDKPEKQVIKLSHVIQQFRMVILQNYKKFIVDLLSNFSSDQIVNVIQNNDMLLPIYPFQINIFMHEAQYKTEVELNLQMDKYNSTGVKQNLWFMHMTSIQFNRELSKERIERELHQYYPTSKITDAINTLVNSNYATQKLRKHGLISGTIEEYKNKLKDLHNIKLFMKVCQYANQTDPYSDVDLSSQLVQIFKKKNNLVGQPHDTVKLYASMHKFMLKNDFCQKKTNERGSFTTEELIQFTSQDLVALFFLQNRQRKQFIFNDFRNLYVQLYNSNDQFNAVIQKFINSENCSRIELQIFIKEILNQNIEFQVQNQPLIELLIDGFCKKLQIREDTDTKHFIQLMQEIELNKDLGMKFNKIMQVRKCLGILNVFHCEKFTYYQMLAYQKDNEIFKILLDRYFNQQVKRESVRIEDQEISLDFCRNMLTVLLYILQTIYYDVSEREFLLTYGQVLIEWKQFDVIKGILYDQDVLQKLKIDKLSYINELVRNSVTAIYKDETIEFDQEVKHQIEEILDILQQNNQALRNQEYAKLKLVQIFQKWDVPVHPFDIYTVCNDWNKRTQVTQNGRTIILLGSEREEFITNLFDVYLGKLSFQTFQHIYTYLQLTDSSQTEVREVQLNNTEYVKFILMFAQRLLKQQRYSQIIEIFAFVKAINGTNIEYQLLTESFLKQICLLYPQSSQLAKGKQLIQYFAQNLFDDKVLQKLFQSNFDQGHFSYEGDRETHIVVDSSYCFRKHRVEVPLDVLWSIVQSEVKERQSVKKSWRGNNEQIYYCYYFLLMVFRNPSNGLRKLGRVSYNLQILTNLMFRLEQSIDTNNSLWAINCFYLFKSFLKGLLLIGVVRVKESNQNMNSMNDFKHQDQNIEVIKNMLKEDKAKNRDLLDNIQRLQTYINATKATKKNQKQLRFEKSKQLELQAKPKQPQPEIHQDVQINDATMNLRTMREMKYQFTQKSNLSVDYISEKQALQEIYRQIFQEKQQARARQKREAGHGLNLFLTGLGVNNREGATKEVIDKIINDDLEGLGNTLKEEVLSAIRSVYESGQKNFHQVVNILDSLKFGDRKKIQIGRLCKIYQGDIPTQDLRHIFPFNFFLQLQAYHEDEASLFAYNGISKVIQNILISKDNQYLRSIAIFMGSILQSNVFIDQVYTDTLISIGERYSFNQQTIIRIRVIMEVLSQNSPHVIRQNINKILHSFRDNGELSGIVKHELQSFIKQHFPKETEILQKIRSTQ